MKPIVLIFTVLIVSFLFPAGFAIADSQPIASIPPVNLLLLANNDACPTDPFKTEPGICGCGVPDEDIDSNGVMDCLVKPGWTDIRQFLVVSDGTHSLGETNKSFNDTRDQGSKIVFFNSEDGDNEDADVYWWDGTQLVDSQGRTANPDNGEPYGTDPLQPNEAAIKPFKTFSSENDDRLLTQQNRSWNMDRVAGGYPDWFLFRRGQTFRAFDNSLAGGRSRQEPMVVSAYGPIAQMRPKLLGALGGLMGGNSSEDFYWFHQVVQSVEISHYGWIGGYVAMSASDGQPITAMLEDVYISGGEDGLTYLPTETLVRRSVIANATDLGYWTYEFKAKVTFDEVIFYRNGFSTNPLTDPDPVHDKYTRNIYQGGGAQMGHTYRNIISAFGGSGGPQMRLGGLLENSLIVEGYFYCSTESNHPRNEWLETNNQSGQSCVVKNNVQQVYRYPNEKDPDTHGTSDTSAQPGHGFTLQGASFGSDVEGNIISGAMMKHELVGDVYKGIGLKMGLVEYSNGEQYTHKNNTVRNNIVYLMQSGVEIEGSTVGASNNIVENNVFVAEIPVSRRMANALTAKATEISIEDNDFYTDNSLPDYEWLSNNNLIGSSEETYPAGWTDPDRTIKRYVTEFLGLHLLDWGDDPFLDATEKQIRVDNGEDYDPSGVKTFMAVAEHMRYGGSVATPFSGTKPSITADYDWDERYTGKAVVNWIREGFNLPPVE